MGPSTAAQKLTWATGLDRFACIPAFAEVSKIEEIDIFPQATGAGGELR
jgi:hypothetical protein